MDKEIGKRLAELRGERSQSTMGHMCGVTSQAWSQWETGVRGIPAERAILLSDRVGITLDWIYRGVKP